MLLYLKEWQYYRFPNNVAESSDLFVVRENKIGLLIYHEKCTNHRKFTDEWEVSKDSLRVFVMRFLMGDRL